MTISHNLWHQVCSIAALDRAWEKVRSNAGCSGGDGITISQFQPRAARQLITLATALEGGGYRPSPLRQIDIPKKKGGTRRLLIPSIIDRIVHTSIASALNPILEPQFEEGSFAYRPGRSVQQAVQAIDRFRKAGYWYVIEADIVGFFDQIRHENLMHKLEQALGDHEGAEELVDCLAHWMEHLAEHTGVSGKGVAQGSPVSPILANLYLDSLDEALDKKGVRIVRFADDFVVLCKKRDTAEEALKLATDVLAEHGLELHADGTRVIDFDRGFEFLGHLFVRSLVMHKVSDPEEDLISVLRDVAGEDTRVAEKALDLEQDIATEKAAGYDRGDRVLYLNEAGRSLTLRNLSYSVRNAEDREIAAISHDRVDRIEISNRVSFDPSIIKHALGTETELVFVNGYGEAEGWLATPNVNHGALHYSQAEALLDPTFRLDMARKIVDARIRNQRTQLFRLNRRQKHADVTDKLSHMGRTLRRLKAATSVQELLGYEGAASADYWPAIGALSAGASSQRFKRERPALTPLNATLNYFTAILERDVRSALLSANLHTGFGILHSARDRSDAAVYDLMEAFRAPLAEGLAVFLFNSNRLKNDMFTKTEGGIRIQSSARRAIITGYEQALAKRVNVTGKNVKLAWRPLMRRQAFDLAACFRHKDISLFQPYLMEA